MNPLAWNVDIDVYLNRFIPSPPWQHLPYRLAWFLGYRKEKPRELGNVVVIFWAFIGIFLGLLLIELATRYIPVVEKNGGPIIVGSFVSRISAFTWLRNHCSNTTPGSGGSARVLRH